MLKELYFKIENTKRYIRIFVSALFLLLPIKTNKIVMNSYFGKGYGDNGKYIVKEIIKQELDYDIVWLIQKDLLLSTELPSKVRTAKYGSLKGLYELATAKIWIDNSRKTFYPIKRKNQYYIQTWHGGIALKKIERDAKEALSKNYINIAQKDSKMADLLVSNSLFCTEMYRNAFWYDKEIIEVGSPRCDIFFEDKFEVQRKVKEYYKIKENIKIILYAPTFRKGSSTDIYSIDFKMLLSALEKRFKSDWAVLVRLHPIMSRKANFMNYSRYIINASEYDDMYELLASSDILITDYSSTMFEFSLMKKPVFLYAPDLEEYRRDRDLYFDIENLPYVISKNNVELKRRIETYNEEKYIKDLEYFLKQLNIFERGNAARKIVDRIKQIN